MCERETETRDSLEFFNAGNKNLVDGLMDAHLSDTGGGLDIAAPKGLLIIAIIRDPRSIQPSLFLFLAIPPQPYPHPHRRSLHRHYNQ